MEEQRHKDALAREERMTNMMLEFTKTITLQANNRDIEREEARQLKEHNQAEAQRAEMERQEALAQERERKQLGLEEERIQLERERLALERETRRQAIEEQRKRDKIRAKMTEKEDVYTYLDITNSSWRS